MQSNFCGKVLSFSTFTCIFPSYRDQFAISFLWERSVNCDFGSKGKNEQYSKSICRLPCKCIWQLLFGSGREMIGASGVSGR